MRTIHIDASISYDVLIGEGLIDQVGERMRQVIAPCQAAIVTDSTVNALYGQAVEDSLIRAGYKTCRFAFEAGEKSKHIGTLSDILEFLAEHQMTRTDVVVALGGGVPGDVAGFAAAVYARGIRFVQVPTTLLAAVDSSVGGKTAVDLRAGKNLAGAFHQPLLVLTDLGVLRGLPQELLSDGAAEVIKYGVLRDEELFGWMCQANWTDRMAEIVERSVAIKRDVVNADEHDNGIRQTLNLGHTFGHAVEACSSFSLSHGSGVAIGMAIAAGAAGEKGICRRILEANKSCGLPLTSPYPPEKLAAVALTDKKRKGDSITLVLPEKIGQCKLQKIPVVELEEAFRRGMDTVKELIG